MNSAFTQGQASGVNPSALIGYAGAIIGFINGILVPVLFAVAFITFLWGVVKYFILNAENEEERVKGRQYILWGVIGFAVIVSVWGLVNLAVNVVGLGAGGSAAQNNLKPPTL